MTLSRSAQPAVPIESLLAIDLVTLAAADAPPAALKAFYTRVLPLKLLDQTPELLRFSFQRREIVLSRTHDRPGRLALLLPAFSEALTALRDHKLPYELLHTDSGLTRMAIVRDPAMNWIHLLETRAF